LVTTIEDLSAYGVAFVSLRDNLDLSTPSERLMMHIIGAMAQFERELIKERVSAGMHAARKRGSRIGRPRAYTNAGNYFSVLQGIKQRLHDTTRRPRRDVVEPGTPGADRGEIVLRCVPACIRGDAHHERFGHAVDICGRYSSGFTISMKNTLERSGPMAMTFSPNS
jgi:hypothetical protein